MSNDSLARSAIEAKKPFERRERHTIMDGTVIEFAPAFEEHDGPLGKRYEPQGWHLSASRNAVVVHRADLGSGDAVRAFAAALAEAEVLAADMGRRGNFDPASTPPSQSGEREANLAMMIRRLASKVGQLSDKPQGVVTQAMALLDRYELQGASLRRDPLHIEGNECES